MDDSSRFMDDNDIDLYAAHVCEAKEGRVGWCRGIDDDGLSSMP